LTATTINVAPQIDVAETVGFREEKSTSSYSFCLKSIQPIIVPVKFFLVARIDIFKLLDNTFL